mmetsp:Transcript_20000/g.24236  ORF Transcript_20000/g.24236 Transcript_20000/m.24236 type:complete len:106 (+) Transcript_20000:42-359(+)
MSDVDNRAENEDEKKQRSLLCNRELDEMFFCASIRNQSGALYRDGKFDSCSDTFAAWMACLKGKSNATNIGINNDIQESHVWDFKERPCWNLYLDETPTSSQPTR